MKLRRRCRLEAWSGASLAWVTCLPVANWACVFCSRVWVCTIWVLARSKKSWVEIFMA